MPENENRGSHFRTQYDLIDTQAFRKTRFDWKGRSLKKLTEFANQDQLRLLVTDETMGEVAYNRIRPHASLGYKPPAPKVFVPALANLAGCATWNGPADQTGAQANLKLTFQLDHSVGTDHSS